MIEEKPEPLETILKIKAKEEPDRPELPELTPRIKVRAEPLETDQRVQMRPIFHLATTVRRQGEDVVMTLRT